MTKIFESFDEAMEIIREVTDKYQKDVPIYTKGKNIIGINKTVTFILLVQPTEDDNFPLKDELILLKSKGYPITQIEWQPKFADQMDMLLEMIEITVEIKTFAKK